MSKRVREGRRGGGVSGWHLLQRGGQNLDRVLVGGLADGRIQGGDGGAGAKFRAWGLAT